MFETLSETMTLIMEVLKEALVGHAHALEGHTFVKRSHFETTQKNTQSDAANMRGVHFR